MCKCSGGGVLKADPLKKMAIKPAQTLTELLTWYEECRREIEICPKGQRRALLRLLDIRFHEEQTRLRTSV